MNYFNNKKIKKPKNAFALLYITNRVNNVGKLYYNLYQVLLFFCQYMSSDGTKNIKL